MVRPSSKRPRRTSPPGLQHASAAVPHSAFGDLNAAQRDAVEHGDGPMLVLAGAGSGKTRVIVARIARLLQRGVAPEHILAVTFTNKAAREMRERLALIASRAAARVRLSTFHALGLHILQQEHQAAGLARHFAIYDTSDLLGVVRELARQTQLAERRLDLTRVLEHLQRSKRLGLAEVPLQWGDDYELAAYDLYPRYLAQMQAFGAVDFDDLITRSTRLVRSDAVAPRWRERFAHVLVDEYQDTSPDQLALLQALVPKGGNVCAVGDDDQAIYAWRGAASDNIRAFSAAFGGSKKVVLTENYRSTEAILGAANAVIACNAKRTEKVLTSVRGPGAPVEVIACGTCEDEANFLARRVHALRGEGVSGSQIAVLFRANAQARLLEETFRAERLETKVVGGQSLFERKEARDVFAFLGVVASPSDEVSLRRIVNVPARGLGPAALEKLTAWAKVGGVSLWRALGDESALSGLAPAARQGAGLFVHAITAAQAQVASGTPATLGAMAEGMISSLALREAVERSHDPSNLQARRLEHIHSSLRALGRFAQRQAEQHPQASARALLTSFLRAQTLRTDDAEQPSEEQAVRLMTVHAAKGLEFDYVFVAGMEEGLLPHRRSLEDTSTASDSIGEERRLCYVAMTRAKKRLWLCHALSRRKHGRMEPRTASRFLQELPEGVVRRNHDVPTAGDEVANAAAAERFFTEMRQKLGLPPRPTAVASPEGAAAAATVRGALH